MAGRPFGPALTVPVVGVGPVPLAVNLTGVVEHPRLGAHPYRVDRQGRPYVPAGDGGVVLGLHLGDSVFAHDADHAAPGACLVHPEPPARAALTALSCAGNRAVVRSGTQAGAGGAVLGKRGEAGRVVVTFPPEVLVGLRPGDEVLVRAEGQGATLEGRPEVAVMNVSPQLLARLPVAEAGAGALQVSVRCEVPSRLAGNGVGRPAHMWDLDLQVQGDDDGGAGGIRLGDLVAVADLDARHNVGFRRGWRTIGLIVHGSSPQPGHGPGLMPLFSAPAPALEAEVEGDGHRGLTETLLAQLAVPS